LCNEDAREEGQELMKAGDISI
jgi:hypothetical protein